MSAQDTGRLEGTLYERESLVREGAKELRSLLRYRELVRLLVKSSLATESTGTVFGSLWWLLDPLVLMGVYYVFVELILRAGGDNYALLIFIGVTAWKHFASSATAAITGTLRREQLMRQVAFPKTVLPLAAVLAGTLHFLIALGVFLALSLLVGLTPEPVVLLVLIPVVIQVMLTLGVAYALAALNIFFRDVQNLAGYAFRLFFFLSPALYTIDQIPEAWRPIYDLNPFATLFPAYHAILLDHSVPDLSALAIIGIASAAMLAAGYFIFVRLEQSFTKVT
jgi:ABC-type polysaccharide/polyol phosphate export permease